MFKLQHAENSSRGDDKQDLDPAGQVGAEFLFVSTQVCKGIEIRDKPPCEITNFIFLPFIRMWNEYNLLVRCLSTTCTQATLAALGKACGIELKTCLNKTGPYQSQAGPLQIGEKLIETK